MARGGARQGAGRKPRIDEITIIKNMDAVLVPENVWQALADKVIDGDVTAIKTWLSYRFGQPKQSIDYTTDLKPLQAPIQWISSDKHLDKE